MSSKAKVSRRQFLTIGTVAAAGTILAACGATPTATPVPPTPVPPTATKPPAAATATTAPAAPAAPTATTAPAAPTATKPPAAPTAAPTAAPAAAAKFKEAPMLADMVKAGKLPPVDQRLPKDPQVIKPVTGTGQYGGTLRGGQPDSGLWSFQCLRCVGLFRYNFANSEIILDMAKSYKFSADAKTFSLELRDGQKWSDGTPFTVDDIIFWWEDIANNADLTPAPNTFFRPGGQPAVFKKTSATTLDMTFAIPYPVVLDRLGRSTFSADPPGNGIICPSAYLKKYHIKYNPDAGTVATAEKFDDWKKLFWAHATPAGDTMVGRPYLWPWIPESMDTQHAVVTRNPYFLAVDTDGNQLPYIDKVDWQITGNLDVQVLKAGSGEFDFEAYHLTLANMPVIKAGETKGNYKTLQPKQLRTSDCALMPNRTVQDTVLKDLFNKKDFRIALSLAINRKAINDAIYFGLATAFPGIGHPGLSFFKKEWATMYIDYDPKQANTLLDGLGLTKKDADGFRLRPDGKGRISLLNEIGVLEGPKQQICDMVNKDWAAVGIEATTKVYEGTLFNQKHAANELMIPNWHLDRAALGGRSNPLFFGWDDPTQQRWGGQWALWFQTSGKQGIEPPDEIKKNKADLDTWRGTMLGTPEFNTTGAAFHAYFPTEIPMIGTVGMAPVPLVVATRLQNVPSGTDITWTSDTNFYAPYMPQQWWIKS